MKAFLKHDENGLLYRREGEWVPEAERALAFGSTSEAEEFRRSKHIAAAHPITRLDPALMTKLLARPPGGYQIGE